MAFRPLEEWKLTGKTLVGERVHNMQKWEYMCIRAPHTRARDIKIGGENASHIYQIETIMNSLGDQGWELVAVKEPLLGDDRGAVLFFKRSKP